MSPKTTDRTHARRPYSNQTLCGRRIVASVPRHSEVLSRQVTAVADDVTCKSCQHHSGLRPEGRRTQ